jgi:hypothetical protein
VISCFVVSKKFAFVLLLTPLGEGAQAPDAPVD